MKCEGDHQTHASMLMASCHERSSSGRLGQNCWPMRADAHHAAGHFAFQTEDCGRRTLAVFQCSTELQVQICCRRCDHHDVFHEDDQPAGSIYSHAKHSGLTAKRAVPNPEAPMLHLTRKVCACWRMPGPQNHISRLHIIADTSLQPEARGCQPGHFHLAQQAGLSTNPGCPG